MQLSFPDYEYYRDPCAVARWPRSSSSRGPR
jgi:hypothetical protein